MIGYHYFKMWPNQAKIFETVGVATCTGFFEVEWHIYSYSFHLHSTFAKAAAQLVQASFKDRILNQAVSSKQLGPSQPKQTVVVHYMKPLAQHTQANGRVNHLAYSPVS